MENTFYKKINTIILLYSKNPQYAVGLFLKKLSSPVMLMINFPLFPLYLLFIAIIRLIRKKYLIRFGQLESEGIGHFSIPLEIYLHEVKSGVHSAMPHIDIWYTHRNVCNEALRKIWSKHLIVAPRLVKPLHLLNRMIPGGEIHEIPYRRIINSRVPWQIMDIYSVLPKSKQIIKLSDTEKDKCFDILRKSGFDASAKYVCISVRDGAYHNDSTLCAHRNSSINDYIGTMSYLMKLGYQVVRIGAKSKESVNINNSLVFDYSNSGIRTELLDLFLISECEFLVGTGTGVETVANLFRVPKVVVNISEIGFLPWYQLDEIVIFKKYMDEDGEIIPLSTVYKKGWHKFTLAKQFEDVSIELVNNTTKEINSVILEMHSRLNGEWKEGGDEQGLQDNFRKLFPQEPYLGAIKARIGADFLRSNKMLLK